MALIGNRSVLLKSPGRFLSGTVASPLRVGFTTPGQTANRFQSLSPVHAAIPSGHLAPSAWRQPRTAGGMSSRSYRDIQVSTSEATIAAGRNMTGTASVTISAGVADLQLIVSATGTAAITITASGSAVGALFGSGTSAVTITTNTPTLGAIINATGTAAIQVSATGTPRAIGWMTTGTEDTGLTPATIAAAAAAAVWSWAAESGVTAEEALRTLLAVASGVTTIDTSGAAPVVTFMAPDGTTPRVSAVMDGSERASVTVTP